MVEVIAHRGASVAAPENTVEAFRLARELGAERVELDARRTADGYIVVHHDALLPDGRAILGLARAALPGYICDLAAALDACAGTSVNIEIKNSPDEPDFDPDESVAAGVVAEVRRRGSQASTLISSFHRPTIERVRALDPQVATALLFERPVGSWRALAADVRSAGHAALHPWDPLVDAALVDAARENGLAVNVWTVDDPGRMAQLIDLGVGGLCTNVPDVARQVVDSRGRRGTLAIPDGL